MFVVVAGSPEVRFVAQVQRVLGGTVSSSGNRLIDLHCDVSEREPMEGVEFRRSHRG